MSERAPEIRDPELGDFSGLNLSLSLSARYGAGIVNTAEHSNCGVAVVPSCPQLLITQVGTVSSDFRQTAHQRDPGLSPFCLASRCIVVVIRTRNLNATYIRSSTVIRSDS